MASDLQRVDIAQLNPEALGNIKKLSVSPRLVHREEVALDTGFVGSEEHSPVLTVQPTASTVHLPSQFTFSRGTARQLCLAVGGSLGYRHGCWKPTLRYVSAGYHRNRTSLELGYVLRSQTSGESLLQHPCASLI